jgi:hypothetical protein
MKKAAILAYLLIYGQTTIISVEKLEILNERLSQKAKKIIENIKEIKNEIQRDRNKK